MAERWREVGEELGVHLPWRIGALVLPLFDGERSDLIPVRTSLGVSVGRLVDHGDKNEDGKRNLVLTTATIANGRAIVETHRPRELPENAYGPVLCQLSEFSEQSTLVGIAPRTPYGIRIPTRSDDASLNLIAQGALDQLDPLVDAQGVDIFAFTHRPYVNDVLRNELDGHRFEPALQSAIMEAVAG